MLNYHTFRRQKHRKLTVTSNKGDNFLLLAQEDNAVNTRGTIKPRTDQNS